MAPVPLAAAIARATRHLGIGVTMSTTFLQPFDIARQLATLDQLSGGRIAWNIVASTADDEAQNFGMDKLPDREARYDKADEVVEACLKLWNSFPANALVRNQETGQLVDIDQLDWFTYQGEFVRTKGPLPVPQSPQGRPVLMQAGASERGREFAARWGEFLFTERHSPAEMKALYDNIKGRMPKYGRTPDQCKILFLATVVVGETEAIAREKNEHSYQFADEKQAIGNLSLFSGVDMSAFPADGPLPEVDAEAGFRGVYDGLMELAREQGLSLGAAARHLAIDWAAPLFVGTPEQVADAMQNWFEQDVCDGFILTFKSMPGDAEEFVRSVVPILQERGLYRTCYEGSTLRENMGL